MAALSTLNEASLKCSWLHDEQYPSNLTLPFGVETDIWGVDGSEDASEKENVVVGICSDELGKIICSEI
jgi:hypothetical protein